MSPTLFSIAALAASAYVVMRPSVVGWIVAAGANAAAAWLVWQGI